MNSQFNLAVICCHFVCCLVAAQTKSQKSPEITQVHHFIAINSKKYKSTLQHHFMK